MAETSSILDSQLYKDFKGLASEVIGVYGQVQAAQAQAEAQRLLTLKQEQEASQQLLSEKEKALLENENTQNITKTVLLVVGLIVGAVIITAFIKD